MKFCIEIKCTYLKYNTYDKIVLPFAVFEGEEPAIDYARHIDGVIVKFSPLPDADTDRFIVRILVTATQRQHRRQSAEYTLNGEEYFFLSHKDFDKGLPYCRLSDGEWRFDLWNSFNQSAVGYIKHMFNVIKATQ